MSTSSTNPPAKRERAEQSETSKQRVRIARTADDVRRWHRVIPAQDINEDQIHRDVCR